MPTDKPRRIPTYRLHKNSGRALTTIAGRDYFLGRYGSPASFQKCEQFKRQWLTYGVITSTTAPPDLTVVELLTRFGQHAERHYPPTPGAHCRA